MPADPLQEAVARAERAERLMGDARDALHRGTRDAEAKGWLDAMGEVATIAARYASACEADDERARGYRAAVEDILRSIRIRTGNPDLGKETPP